MTHGLKKTAATAAWALLAIAVAPSAQALTLQGGSLFATADEEITITLSGISTAYRDRLTLADSDDVLFDSQQSALGANRSLGMMPSGGELVFRLNVLEPDGDSYAWFSGPASRNADNTQHARILDLGGNRWRLSWEDLSLFDPLFDGDFNDLMFIVESRPIPVIPEPATLSLVGLGLGATGWVRRRRKRR
ncbi:MAG TPA: PEP-CTERM sorting domain-containing protein [Candidatus Sumerlaeota bacterium]|nr:PEP-CTERM sorting domain-containing protein [Candidatus Sumerlaeota bacterium]